MKVTVRGTAGLYFDTDDWPAVEDPQILSKLDGFKSEQGEADEFAPYIDAPELRAVGLQGGFIEIQFDRSRNQLYVVTEYDSPRRLSDDELRLLVKHTTEQWCDGLGESLDCPYAEENNLHLDLAPMDQQVEVEQN